MIGEGLLAGEGNRQFNRSCDHTRRSLWQFNFGARVCCRASKTPGVRIAAGLRNDLWFCEIGGNNVTAPPANAG